MDELKNFKPIGSTVTGEGMNLYITDSHNQTSNGKLLHVDDYHYVHNQRYSAEALSSILSDYKAEKTFNAYYSDNLVLFERYNLYELPSVEIINGQLQNTFNSFVITKNEEDEKLDK